MSPLLPNQVDGAYQVGYSFPATPYIDTKANIEALVGVPQGAVAYATDTDELGTYDGVADWTWIGAGGGSFDLPAEIHAAASDATFHDDDEFPKSDSQDSWDLKKFTWANLKAGLKTYFDTVYDAVGAAAAALASAMAYADSLIVGLWDDRGNFDASVNAYPSSGGSGTAGAILKGDIWTISVAGTLPTGQVVEVGDTVRALINTPGNTQANWAIAQQNIGYVAENSANKSTDVNTDQASNTKYPSVKAVYDWAVGLFSQLSHTHAGIVDNEADSKKLAFVQLASSKTDIYDPGANYGKIKTIWLHNTNIADELVTINLHDGTNEYEIDRFTLEPLEFMLLEYPHGLPVNAASKITGLATDAAMVTCLVSGNEKASDWEEQVLAFVQLADTKSDIYDSGANLGIVHHIILHNIHTAAEIPTLYLHDGTNEYQVAKVLLDDDPRETMEVNVPESGLIVDSASKITGKSNTAAKVTCLVIGVER